MTREVALKSLYLEHKNFINPRRFTGLGAADINELSESITANGLLTPPQVVQLLENGNVINLVWNGQRRVLASIKALGENAKIQVVDLSDEPIEPTPEALDQILLKALAVVPGVEISSYEISEVAEHLRSRGRDQAAIAAAIHKSPSWVSRMLKARSTATPKLMLAWRKGEVTDEQFKDLAAEKAPEKQEERAEAVVESRKSGDKAEARTKAKEVVESAKDRKKREKADRLAKIAAVKAQKVADAKAAKDAKLAAKAAKTHGKNGVKPAVTGEQTTMGWTPPPKVETPKKPPPPKRPSIVALTEMVGLADQRPPTHDYVKGLLDGTRHALGLLEADDLAKPWAQYLARVGGTTLAKPVAKAKAKSKSIHPPKSKRVTLAKAKPRKPAKRSSTGKRKR